MPGLLAKTSFEQRRPLYEDVEALIVSGFLSHSIRIYDTHISFRSLCPGDLALLRARSNGQSVYEWQRWAVASSVWMVDGFNLLGEQHSVPRIFQSLGHLPLPTQELLFSLVLGLFSRSNKAVDAAEVFSYETHSRFLWKGLRGEPMSNNGIPGASHLGLNTAQQIWSVFNEAEDQRIEDDIRWNGFKLVASAMSPKGVKKLDQKDQQNQLNEKERRQAAMDKFYYIQTGVIKPPKKGDPAASPMVPGPKSSEELEDEMYRWVTGQDDFHDKVIKEYKRKVAQRYMEEKKQREARAEVLRQRMYEIEERSNPLVGYTADQMADILKDRKPGHPGVKWVPGGQQASRDYLYERYLEKGPDAGLLSPTSDGRLQETDGSDLAQRVSSRTVAFRSKEDRG